MRKLCFVVTSISYIAMNSTVQHLLETDIWSVADGCTRKTSEKKVKMQYFIQYFHARLPILGKLIIL